MPRPLAGFAQRLERNRIVVGPRCLSPAWTAAPSATVSSAFSEPAGRRPNSRLAMRRTTGMRVAPPTRITSSSWSSRIRASRRARVTGWRRRSSSGVHSVSNSADVTAIS